MTAQRGRRLALGAYAAPRRDSQPNAGAPEQLLRRLAASDERSLTDVLASRAAGVDTLDRRTRALVQLAALLAVDGGTCSLRWAVDKASGAGAGDAELVQVLITAGSMAGEAQTVSSAARLALALGVDLEMEGWDGT